MKFIFNFIFFGLLFYVIWVYFPDAFATLLRAAETALSYLKELGSTLYEKLSSMGSSGHTS
jgi:hypothetical protein